MDTIRTTCSGCCSAVEAPYEHAGEWMLCPRCGADVYVPWAEAPPLRLEPGQRVSERPQDPDEDGFKLTRLIVAISGFVGLAVLGIAWLVSGGTPPRSKPVVLIWIGALCWVPMSTFLFGIFAMGALQLIVEAVLREDIKPWPRWTPRAQLVWAFALGAALVGLVVLHYAIR